MRYFSLFCLILLNLSPCWAAQAGSTYELMPTEKMVAQKLMIDIRHFETVGGCDFEKAMVPVTMLPSPVVDMIENLGIGGVVLFGDNLKSSEQILRLTKGLQEAAAKGGHPPLMIATDQEGGHVVRLPSNMATSFSGNMALGATQAKFKTTFAAEVAAMSSRELLCLGINTNFAPVADVNTNPQNPVINVRSFGDNPENVALLASAMVESMQDEGLIATLKHFPGHGDTLVDSHSNLPRVDRSVEQVEAVELYPFAKAIEWATPDMVMVGHLQYPALDSSKFPWPPIEEVSPSSSIAQEELPADEKATQEVSEVPGIVWPASLSAAITTDWLRGKLGFEGVVITDSLQMKAITQYFTPTQAVINAFRAGADIALMPLKIEASADIVSLRKLIAEVAAAVDDGRLDSDKMTASLERIKALKQKYPLTKATDLPLERSVAIANKTLGKAQHRRIEQELANHSVVVLKNQAALPVSAATENIFLHMPNKAMAVAFKTALHQRIPGAHITYATQLGQNADVQKAYMAHSDVVIMADIFPELSLSELAQGEELVAEDLTRQEIVDAQLELLKTAKAQGKQVIFVCLRTPYNAQTYSKYSNAMLVSFDYRVNRWDFYLPDSEATPIYEGPTYSALANIITGKEEADATLPIQLEPLSPVIIE